MRKLALGPLVAVAALAVAADGIAGPKDAELEIGKKGPAFKLVGTDGEKHALKDFVKKSEATVVVFTCNSCPYSQGYEPILLDMAARYDEKPVSFVLVNSNSVEVQPKDSYDLMVERAKETRAIRSPICTTRPRRSPPHTVRNAHRTSSFWTPREFCAIAVASTTTWTEPRSPSTT